MFIQERLNEYWSTARERYNMLLRRRRGEPGPWSSDPHLNKWRFCNVFREDDRTTLWIRDNIREPLRDDHRVLVAMVAARFFNKIETLDKIKDILLEGWDSTAVRARLDGHKPVTNGCYIVKTPDGMNKLDGVCWIVDQIAADDDLPLQIHPGDSLRSVFDRLIQYPFLGGFMAYEIVSDLRWTYMLEDAPDIETWANPGPGAKAGLRILMHNDEDANGGKHRGPRDRVHEVAMRELFTCSRDPDFWPEEWPEWEMREVEHWLCEYAKWWRAAIKNVKKLKRRYP